MKCLILQRNLPKDVVEDIEDILSRGKAAAGATAYKDAEVRILQIQLQGDRAPEGLLCHGEFHNIQDPNNEDHLLIELRKSKLYQMVINVYQPRSGGGAVIEDA